MNNDGGDLVRVEEKSVELAQAASVQSRARKTDDSRGMPTLLMYLLSGVSQGVIPGWWSPARDVALGKFWRESTHLSGSFYTLASKLASVPFRIEPRDFSVLTHGKVASQFQSVLEEESEFSHGWIDCITKWLMDLWSQDNGAFLEVIGDGPKDGPISGPALGIAHLDSSRCIRTGSVEYPVVYIDIDGNRYKFHRSRIIYKSQMPSPRAEMNGVGFCWVSRTISIAQTLIDIQTYKMEKMGSRPKRAFLLTKGGLDPDIVTDAISVADYGMKSEGLTRYSRLVVMGDHNMPDAGLEIIDLASLPDGFDEQTSTTLGMFAIALAGAVPPRWLWPATTVGATKADAMYQHVSGLTGGPGVTLSMLANAIGGAERASAQFSRGKVLPPFLKIVFDFQDDEQDRTQAEIRRTRAEGREIDLRSGVFSIRVTRELALSAGDITESQFVQMELDDGRLQNGDDILSLFSLDDPFFMEVLNLGVDDPLAVYNNDPTQILLSIEYAIIDLQDIMTNSPADGTDRRKGKQAMAALKKLKEIYRKFAIDSMILEQEAAVGEREERAVQEPDQGDVDQGYTAETGVQDGSEGQTQQQI